jgi:hypothetical protein
MWLLIIILVILASVYAYKTYNKNIKYNSEYQILQLKPAQLTDAIIEERNPIIVETNEIVNEVLMSDVLRNKAKRVKKVKSNTQAKNDARLKVIYYNKDEKAMVEIINPKHSHLDKEDPQYQSMTIVLRKGHVLLLPFMWHFSSDRDLTSVDVHDWFSQMYSLMLQ